MLGMAQTGISTAEQEGATITDRFVKSICLAVPGLNEAWLRDGVEPIYIQPPTFSLDQFVKDRGATGLELEIVKAYFELDPAIRHAVLEHFKTRFSVNADTAPADLVPDTAEELEAQFPPVDAGSASGVDAG